MKVQVEMKITILEGDQKGRVIEEKPTVMDTIPEPLKGGGGTIETVKIQWYMVNLTKDTPSNF